MFKSVRFNNFKGLREYNINLKQTNVLVGPNNAGKSTILDGFRALSAAIKFAGRRNPTPLSIRGQVQDGWDVPLSVIPISIANIHADYREELETSIVFTTASGRKLKLSFLENARVVLIVDDAQQSIRNTSQFKRQFPIAINSIPTLGPLEEDEQLLSDEYVERWRGSRLSHRMFRNIWYRNEGEFEEFKSLVETTWPGMSIRPPERYGYAPARLTMFCEENRMPRELSWAGFGFQVWLQLLTHLIGARDATTLIVDEPEIYLHPDLQHRLFSLLRKSGKQVILATHSVEIINEAEHDDVVLINRARRSAKRISDIDGLQDALFSIGSAQNIHLSKLSRGKKILFLEGQEFKLIKRFAARVRLEQLANDIDLTVVPLGGFTQRQKIQDSAWIFEKVLRAEISIAALLDRDYRCNEEVDELVSNMRTTVKCFHILGAKEIENYLLVPDAIRKAVNERLRERAESTADSTVTDETVIKLLDGCTNEVKPEVSAQIISHRSQFLGNKYGRDSATVVTETIRNLDSDWSCLQKRLFIVPGKQILASLNRQLQSKYGVSITPAQIIKHLSPDQIDVRFAEILREFNTFATG
ncbi:ATP-binding protein [Methylocystis sp. JR02]|uniref:ATP-dependent nuclease n=1 Tax=Methylocystis sp. JR02 TaxID=3046284 RepID=UPI0024BA8237|nr:ATP-binding protein [Methylocystis sp. JR02]MDJ0449141.1 AAA family ATPase [Methylocystis sp. JR02]